MDYTLDRSNLEALVIGKEEYVLIEPTSSHNSRDIYLDNNPKDRSTELFLTAQNRKLPKYRRSYFGDCYGIIDGVAMGAGRAIMPYHLVASDKRVRKVPGTKPYSVNVVLHYYHQPFYSKLHQAIIDHLLKNAPKMLKSDGQSL